MSLFILVCSTYTEDTREQAFSFSKGTNSQRVYKTSVQVHSLLGRNCQGKRGTASKSIQYGFISRADTAHASKHTQTNTLSMTTGEMRENVHCIWVELKLQWLKQVENVYFFFLGSISCSQGHAPLTAPLIATLLARKDSGAAECFSEGHLRLTVPGRPSHPDSMANEETQGFSFRLIIVTVNGFQVPFDCRPQHIILPSACQSPQPTNRPTVLSTQTEIHTHTHTHAEN